MSSIFLEQTRTLLRERPKNLTLALISEETGLGAHWLQTLLYKKIGDDGKEPDFGVVKIETLYNYLATEPIIISPHNSETI